MTPAGAGAARAASSPPRCANDRWRAVARRAGRLVLTGLLALAPVFPGCGDAGAPSSAPAPPVGRDLVAAAPGAPGNGPPAPREPGVPAAPAADADRALRERAQRLFARADLFSPAAADGALVAPALCPLLLLEHDPAPDEAAREGDGLRLGALRAGPDDRPRFDPTTPTVYVERATAVLSGQPHEQLAFLWVARRPGAAPVLHGVRLTLAADGRPALVEVLGEQGGARVLFVSRTLEEKARAAHGTPLPGRSFAVEAAPGVGVPVVVAGLIDDGPVPMGPFVLVESRRGDVTAVRCRCAPSPVEAVAANRTYQVVPLDHLRAAGVSAPVWSPGLLEGTPPDPARLDPASLQRALRLPPAF